MKIGIASDHAGYELKETVKGYLESQKVDCKDYGCHSADRVDYPDFGHALADGYNKDEFDLGIVICGSGNGINMAANKHANIRSALCWKPEIAALARQHNDANVLALPARFIESAVAMECVDAFIKSEFEGGRHENRVKKISC